MTSDKALRKTYRARRALVEAAPHPSPIGGARFPGMGLRWCELTREERRHVSGAIRVGFHGDVYMPTGRWYRIRSRTLWGTWRDDVQFIWQE